MNEAIPMRPAGFWIRAVALLVDVAVYFLANVALSRFARRVLGPGLDGGAPAPGAVFLFTILFAIVYTTTLHSTSGQTLGKSLVGIRVVSASDGTLLTVGPALLRHLASFLSLVPFGFGYLVAGLRRDKRALHDLIAGSRVEWLARRRPSRRVAPRPPGPSLQDAAVVPAAPPPRPPESGPGG